MKTIQSKYSEVSFNKNDIESILKKLALIILDRCKNNKTEQYVNLIYPLKLSLQVEDGLFYYNSELLTKAELIDKYELFYDVETNSFIGKKDMNIPTLEKVLLGFPLYETMSFERDVFEHLVQELHLFREPIDSFCIDCGSVAIFHHSNISSGIRYGNFEVELVCSRNNSHKIIIYFTCINGTLIKIGQFPSIADLAIYDVKKYRKILGGKL